MIRQMEVQLERLKLSMKAGDERQVKEHAAVLKGYCNLFIDSSNEDKPPAGVQSHQAVMAQSYFSKSVLPPTSPKTEKNEGDQGGSLLDF